MNIIPGTQGHAHGHTMIIFERGEPLVQSLTQAISKCQIQGGLLSGIGAIAQVELGYYHLEKRDYFRKTFGGDYELISLMGNISQKENQPFPHVHAVIGDDKFNTFGGHLFEAIVSITVEMVIVPLGALPQRTYNAEMGLSLICGIK